MRIVRATLHGEPLGGGEAPVRARDVVGSAVVGGLVPTGARVVDAADDELVVVARACARGAVEFESVESNFTETPVVVARSTTAPAHTVIRVRRLHGRVPPRITENLLAPA